MSEKKRRFEFDWPKLAAMMLREQGITTGLWQPGIKMQFAGATIGPTNEELLPSGVVGVMGITLHEQGPQIDGGVTHWFLLVAHTQLIYELPRNV